MWASRPGETVPDAVVRRAAKSSDSKSPNCAVLLPDFATAPSHGGALWKTKSLSGVLRSRGGLCESRPGRVMDFAWVRWKTFAPQRTRGGPSVPWATEQVPLLNAAGVRRQQRSGLPDFAVACPLATDFRSDVPQQENGCYQSESEEEVLDRNVEGKPDAGGVPFVVADDGALSLVSQPSTTT